MIDNRRELLTYDISNFKVDTKLRHSHVSLFKIAIRSFERGDFETAFELFNKLACDSFLSEDGRKMVLQNKKDIEDLLETGLEKLEKKDLEKKYIKNYDKNRKYEEEKERKTTKIKKETFTDKDKQKSFTDVDEKETFTDKGEKETFTDKSKNDLKSKQLSELNESNFIDAIKVTMGTFAEKLTSSLSKIINETITRKSDKVENILEIDNVAKVKDEKETQISEKNLNNFFNLGLDGSLQDIFQKEFQSNLHDVVLKDKLTEDDIKRFLSVGINFVKMAPEFMDSINEVKDSLDTLSEEIPEMKKNSEEIKNALIGLDEDEKRKKLDSLKQNLLDDEEIIDNLSSKDAKQSEIFQEHLSEMFEEKSDKNIFDEKAIFDDTENLEVEDSINEISSDYSDTTVDTKDTTYENLEDYIEKNTTMLDEDTVNEDVAIDNVESKYIQDIESEYTKNYENKNYLNDILSDAELIKKHTDKVQRFIRKNANKLSRKLREQLDKLSLLKDDENYTEKDKKELNLKSDSYDEQMPAITDTDIVLPNEENDKYKLINPNELEGNLEKLFKLKKQSESEQYIDRLMNIENEINRIIEYDAESGEIEDLSAKLKKIKKTEKLEKIVQDIQKEMVTNYTKTYKEKDTQEDMKEESITETSTGKLYVPNITIEQKIIQIPEDANEKDFHEIIKEISEKEIEIESDKKPQKNILEMEPLIIKKSQEIGETDIKEEKEDKKDGLIKQEEEDKKDSLIKQEEEDKKDSLTKQEEKSSDITTKTKTVESQNETFIPPKFFETQDNLSKILDKLSDVLETSFKHLMDVVEEKSKTVDKGDEQDLQTTALSKDGELTSEEIKQDTETIHKLIKMLEDKEQLKTLKDIKEKSSKTVSKENVDKVDDKAESTTETKEIVEESNDIYQESKEDTKLIREEDKIKENLSKTEKEEDLQKEDESYFVAEEEVIVKQKKKTKKTPPKLEEEMMSAFPDLALTDEAMKKKSEGFISLEDVIDEEAFENEEYTKEDLLKEEKQKIYIPGLDPNFISGAFVPFEEYKQEDGFFTDIDGNPILKPEEEIPEEEEKTEEEEFIEEDEYTIERAEEKEDEKEEIDLPLDLPKKEKKKPNILKLTYDFRELFHNKTYQKYREILNEAAQLVSEKKLDEALEYYNVILEQNIPRAFKYMIQQNVKDITNTIIETFKRSDTIVNVKESGEIKRLKTKFIEANFKNN